MLNARTFTDVLHLVTVRILRGLGGRVLACGCLVGFYETYSGRTVTILDARDPTCTDTSHLVGISLDMDLGERPDPSRKSEAQN